jgi:hypothetical protein
MEMISNDFQINGLISMISVDLSPDLSGDLSGDESDLTSHPLDGFFQAAAAASRLAATVLRRLFDVLILR